MRVAVLVQDPGLRADILDRLDGRAALRLVEHADEADVVLDSIGAEGGARVDRNEPPHVMLVHDRHQTSLPAGSMVLEDAAGATLEAVLRVTSEGYEVRPVTLGPHWPDTEGDGADVHGRVAHPLLTPRERQVLALLAEGAPNKVIARRLRIAPSTAKFHVASLLDKLGAHSRLDAVAIGARFGLVLL